MAVPADAPPATTDAGNAPPPIAADARHAALGRATALATLESDRPLRIDLFASVAARETPQCVECHACPATPVVLRRPRRQLAFVVVVGSAFVALAVIRRVTRDPSALVGWVLATAAAVFATLPALPWWRVRTIHVTPCRDCGTAQAREQLDRAARSAAIMPASLLWNLAAVARDAQALRRLRSLSRPSQRTPRTRNPGWPLIARPGIVTLAVSLAGVVAFATSDAPFALARWAGIERAAAWTPTACAAIDAQQTHPVTCRLAHDGRVVAVVARSGTCPPATERSVEDAGRWYCIARTAG